MDSRVSRTSNRNWAFAAALFEELGRSGVQHVCVCPGSRSAALAAAAADEPGLRCWSHLDERSAAFFALGLAKASREPVALVCTSGTAAANFHPAVIEAHYSGVPLLVLTADRPAELREWGAGQTIDQVRLYGSHVRWFAEAPLPEPSAASVRYARALACRAVQRALGPPAGPVHLNLPFREPLDPRPVPGERAPELVAGDSLAAGGRQGAPYTEFGRSASTPTPDEIAALSDRMRKCERGVIACGPLDATPDLASALGELAALLGWPILADPTSQLRCGPHVKEAPVLATGDHLLRDAAFAEAHAPEFVLRLGGTPTSKSLRLWLEARAPRELVLVDAEGGWNDPSHLASLVLRCDPVALCDLLMRRLTPRLRGRDASPWLRSFLLAEERVQAAVASLLEADEALLEARAVRELAAELPDGAHLYVSSSMPVRDLDAFLPVSARRLRVLCNRGANGIDGMVSSALGAAAAGEGPLVLLTGDVALLHDCGGLLAAQRHDLAATIVVLDNGGGGIFSFLPVAEYGEDVAFEELFRTPPGVDLGALVEGFGVAFTRATSWEHFRSALKESLSGRRTSVIAIPVDRDRNVEQHRAVQRAVGAALADATAER